MTISDRSYQLAMIAALWSHDNSYVYSGAVGELSGSYISAGEMDVSLIKLKLTAAPKRHYRFLTLTDPQEIDADSDLKAKAIVGN